ncbi:MAG: hypothetical protein M3365_01240 [Gemmatimonadota bacterium]|nr:hypothetical protein [Gemmatimonadota bacterium]
MSLSTSDSVFAPARQVAGAVLYEGYVLYPYRASSQKNQLRWQFGVLTPRDWSEAGGSEPWFSQTELLIEPGGNASIRVKLRFLQAQARTIEEAADRRGSGFRAVSSLVVDGEELVTWDEGIEQEIDAAFDLAALLEGEREMLFTLSEGREIEMISCRAQEPAISPPKHPHPNPSPGAQGEGLPAGRIVRQRWPVEGVLRVGAERLAGLYGVVKLRVRVENVTPWDDPSVSRDAIVRRSLIAAHTIVAVENGTFISLLEPPEWARPAVASCENVKTWPVLTGAAGRRDLMLSSPIILYDYPAIAPESQGDLFDATEIDEILTLRTMALTDAEKREARATDDRAAAIIDRVDAMPAELMDKLHGAIRYLRETPRSPNGYETTNTNSGWELDLETGADKVPWWDPGADASVSPETDSVLIGGVAVARGSRVRLQPGTRRTDAQDMFLIGQIANVEGVFLDVDGSTHLAVTLVDDPGADLYRLQGRFRYFAPDEVEPLEDES